MKTLSMNNHKWGWTVGSNMPITLTVVTLDYATKCGEVPFGVLPFRVTFVVGVHHVCWSLCMNLVVDIDRKST